MLTKAQLGWALLSLTESQAGPAAGTALAAGSEQLWLAKQAGAPSSSPAPVQRVCLAGS